MLFGSQFKTVYLHVFIVFTAYSPLPVFLSTTPLLIVNSRLCFGVTFDVCLRTSSELLFGDSSRRRSDIFNSSIAKDFSNAKEERKSTFVRRKRERKEKGWRRIKRLLSRFFHSASYASYINNKGYREKVKK